MVQTSSLCPSLYPPPGISDPCGHLQDLIFPALLTPRTQGGPDPQDTVRTFSRKRERQANWGGAKVPGVLSTSWSCPSLA